MSKMAWIILFRQKSRSPPPARCKGRKASATTIRAAASRSSAMPTAAPIIELTISEKITPCQPMNAPMAPMNFTSPRPIASRGSTISALTASRYGTSSGLIFSADFQQPDGRQPHRHVLVAAIHQFHRPRLQHNRVRLAVKQFVVGNLLVRQMHGGFGENNFRVRRQFQLLPAEQQFAQPQNRVNDSRAGADAEHALPHARGQRVIASCSDGRKNDAMNPTTMPPKVISSGMMKCSKSMNVAQISPARKMA